MSGTGSDTKLVLPGLRGFYDSFFDVAYTLMRVAIGCILFVHGWGKLQVGAAVIAGSMAKSGLEPGIAFAYAAMVLETIGAACVAIGLFTRFFAPALAIEMAIAFIFVHGPKGFSVSKGGFEYILLLGIVLFVIAIRGGGPYSADRAIGKEL